MGALFGPAILRRADSLSFVAVFVLLVQGLQAQYYAGNQFAVSSFNRTDSMIDFDWYACIDFPFQFDLTVLCPMSVCL